MIPKNLSFNHYIYYQNLVFFDNHPRIFLECAYYGKTMEYFNKGLKDGSYYRWKDYQEYGLKGRQFSKDDEVIRKFI